jgi:hypothetical protein
VAVGCVSASSKTYLAAPGVGAQADSRERERDRQGASGKRKREQKQPTGVRASFGFFLKDARPREKKISRFVLFLLSRNTRKHEKTKRIEEELTSGLLSIFWESFRHGHGLRMDFLQKLVCGVFELPSPLPGAPKNVLKKSHTEAGGLVDRPGPGI